MVQSYRLTLSCEKTYCVYSIIEGPSSGHLTWDVKGRLKFLGNSFKDVGRSCIICWFINSFIPIKTNRVYVIRKAGVLSSENKGAKCTCLSQRTLGWRGRPAYLTVRTRSELCSVHGVMGTGGGGQRLPLRGTRQGLANAGTFKRQELLPG